MRLSTYVSLLFSISLVFYFLGYTSPVMQVISYQSPNCTEANLIGNQTAGTSLNCNVDPGSLLQKIANSITSDSSVQSLLLITGITIAASLLSGFGAFFIIPLILLLVFLNFLVFPTSFLSDPNLPIYVKVPLSLFFNTITVMAILTFVRGSS